jgi:hypothetical protein
LEGLKAEAQVGTMQIAVGEMPWDFWSSMMLRIEALMLDSLITQVKSLCSWKVVSDVQNLFWRAGNPLVFFPSFS